LRCARRTIVLTLALCVLLVLAAVATEAMFR
jgi:hypothetical protein